MKSLTFTKKTIRERQKRTHFNFSSKEWPSLTSQHPPSTALVSINNLLTKKSYWHLLSMKFIHNWISGSVPLDKLRQKYTIYFKSVEKYFQTEVLCVVVLDSQSTGWRHKGSPVSGGRHPVQQRQQHWRKTYVHKRNKTLYSEDDQACSFTEMKLLWTSTNLKEQYLFIYKIPFK